MIVNRPACCTLKSLCVLIGLTQTAHAISRGRFVQKNDPIVSVTASVYSQDDDCTGIKIAANLIVTAKHCELDRSTRVTFFDGNSYKIRDVWIPKAKGIHKSEFDLAVLKIDANVPGPIAELADPATAPKNGSLAWTAGYGGRKLTRKNNPLRKLEVQVIDMGYSPFAATIKTTGDGGVCDGDSGGPGYTVINGRILVWGIDSRSLYGNSRCGSREIYIKVFRELIDMKE